METKIDFDIEIRQPGFGDFADNIKDALELATGTGPGVENKFRIALWLDPERLKPPVISLTTGANHTGTHPNKLGEQIKSAINANHKLINEINTPFAKMSNDVKQTRIGQLSMMGLDYLAGATKKAASGRPIGECGIPGITLSYLSYLMPSPENVNTMAQTFTAFGAQIEEHYKSGNKEISYMEKLLQADIVCYSRSKVGGKELQAINIFSHKKNGDIAEFPSFLTEQADVQLPDATGVQRLSWVEQKVTSIEKRYGITFDRAFNPSKAFNVTFVENGILYKVPYEDVEGLMEKMGK